MNERTITGADAVGAVEAAAELLRTLTLAPDRERLTALIAAELSYGHSNGKVDTKETLIDNLMTGRSSFRSIAISEQSVRVVDDAAIVRHAMSGETGEKGKEPVRVELKILQVWKKTGGEWRLLARQAVRA